MEYLSYYELLNDIVYNGYNYAHTHLLNDVTYRIDCEGIAQVNDEYHDDELALSNSGVIVVPEMRGHLPFKDTYALTELTWYHLGSRNASEIQDHAPLWGRIAQNGKVNSNYGYQLRVNNAVPGGFDAAIEAAARKLITGKRQQVSLDIVSQSNMQDDFDTVCNNRVDVIIESDGRMHLRVVARSIDMIFGLPYDQFNAQVLGHYIAHKINNASLKERETWESTSRVYLSSVTFSIANVHVYNDNLNNMILKRFEENERYGSYRLFAYETIDSIIHAIDAHVRENCLTAKRAVNVVHDYVSDHVVSWLSTLGLEALTDACNGERFTHDDAHDTFGILEKKREFLNYQNIRFMSNNPYRHKDSGVKFQDMLDKRDPSITGYGDRKRVFLTGAGEIVHVFYDHDSGHWFTKTYESLGSLKDMRARG